MKKKLSYSLVFFTSISGWAGVAEDTQCIEDIQYIDADAQYVPADTQCIDVEQQQFEAELQRLNAGLQYIECTIEPRQSMSVLPSRYGSRESLGTLPTFSTPAVNDIWAGYAVATNISSPQAGSVTGVTGYWTVPVISPSSINTYVSIWVGIDGHVSRTIEQIGTFHEWISGKQYNSTWFEMYPAGAFNIQGFPMDIGDEISASVRYIGSSTFQMTIRNHTKGLVSNVPTMYTISSAAQRMSAVWIMESPWRGGTLPLANFGSETIRLCTCTINNVVGTISNSHWQNQMYIPETSSGVIKALPSSLMNFGYRFSITWAHQ